MLKQNKTKKSNLLKQTILNKKKKGVIILKYNNRNEHYKVDTKKLKPMKQKIKINPSEQNFDRKCEDVEKQCKQINHIKYNYREKQQNELYDTALYIQSITSLNYSIVMGIKN